MIMIKDLLLYGNNLETVGVIYGNGTEQRLIMFPEETLFEEFADVIEATHEEWKELLYQTDTLGVEGLQKTILRKSQRQIEANVSWNVFHRDNYRCRYCNKGDGEPMTVDHIVLWEHMGDSVEANLNSACKKCNKTRGNMMYADWLESDYYKEMLKGFATCKQMEFNSDVRDNINFNRIKHAHEKNVKSGEIALKLPLRKTKRNR